MRTLVEQDLKEQLAKVLNENYTLRKELRNLKTQVRELQYELSRVNVVPVHKFDKPKESK